MQESFKQGTSVIDNLRSHMEFIAPTVYTSHLKSSSFSENKEHCSSRN